MTIEQYTDLQKYIPESDTVRAVFKDMHPEFDFSDWEKAVVTLVDRAFIGDKDALFNLLELTYLNAHNEGFLDGIGETTPAN